MVIILTEDVLFATQIIDDRAVKWSRQLRNLQGPDRFQDLIRNLLVGVWIRTVEVQVAGLLTAVLIAVARRGILVYDLVDVCFAKSSRRCLKPYAQFIFTITIAA